MTAAGLYSECYSLFCYLIKILGVLQAENLGKKCKLVEWDFVFSSDLERAHRTARIVLEQHTKDSFDINTTELLREVSFGFLEGMTRGTTRQEGLNILRARHGDDYQVTEDIESHDEIFSRQLRAIDYIMNIISDYQGDSAPKVLVLSHGAFIRHFLEKYCDIDLKKFGKIKNCSMSRIIVEKNSKGDYVFSRYSDDFVNRVFDSHENELMI